ncbi:MAG TPA: type II toxin-antitoxin system RelE/ParE family toxin [Acidimicrobiales bacterium]|nr:type II toxin-antitoxin system RelE/ParE family toxin [Acidimicrobiales bacterium]
MSPWNVQLSSPAVRNLDRLPPRVVPAVVEFLYGPLADDPKRVGKLLRGALEGIYSARRGDYRVLYELIDDRQLVLVVRIAHRTAANRD